jgi:hypothetical protein
MSMDEISDGTDDKGKKGQQPQSKKIEFIIEK